MSKSSIDSYCNTKYILLWYRKRLHICVKKLSEAFLSKLNVIEKIRTPYQTSSEKSQCIAVASSPVQFVSENKMLVAMNTNNNTILETSDKQLLETSLFFGKHHQRYLKQQKNTNIIIKNILQKMN